MPKLKFNLPAPIDSAKAFEKVKGFLNGDNDFKKFDPQAVCTFDEPAKKCSLDGKQFSATLQILDKDPHSCEIEIEVELPFALAMFKGTVQELLEKNLNRILT